MKKIALILNENVKFNLNNWIKNNVKPNVIDNSDDRVLLCLFDNNCDSIHSWPPEPDTTDALKMSEIIDDVLAGLGNYWRKT